MTNQAQVSLRQGASGHPHCLAAQVRVTADYTATATDEIVNVATAGVPITLPLASTRGFLPLMVNDVSGSTSAHRVTVQATAPDTISGLAPCRCR